MKANKVRNEIWISDGSIAREEGDQYDHVITLSRDDGPLDRFGSHEDTTQHVPLYDGPQTDQDDFNRAVGVTMKAIRSDGDMLIHCQAGVSRSATVLITALAEIDDATFDEIHSELYSARPSIEPNPALKKLALEFLGEGYTFDESGVKQ